jgi:hypothetical protein
MQIEKREKKLIDLVSKEMEKKNIVCTIVIGRKINFSLYIKYCNNKRRHVYALLACLLETQNPNFNNPLN